MKKIILCFIILAAVFGNVTAQSTVTSIPPDPEEITFSRKDTAFYGIAPYTTVYIVTLPCLFLPYDTSKYISAGILLAGGIPSVMIDPVSDLTHMGIAAAGIASGFVLDSMEDTLAKTLFAGPLINIGQKT